MNEPTPSARRHHGGDPSGGEPAAERRSVRVRLASARLGMLALVCAAATLLVGPPFQISEDVYPEGAVAGKTVRATRDFLVADELATEAKRQEARQSVPSVYDLGPGALSEALALLDQTFEPEGAAAAAEPGAESPDRRAAATRLAERWQLRLSPSLARTLGDRTQRDHLRSLVGRTLEPLFARGVVANRELLVRDAERGAVLRDLGTGAEHPLVDAARTVDFDEARRELGGAEEKTVGTMAALGRALAAALLRPNIAFNGEETQLRRESAARSVGPVLYQLRRGETLIREGERVSAVQARNLAAHAQESGFGVGRWGEYLVVFLALSCLSVTCLEFARKNIRKARTSGKDLALVASLFLALLALQWVGITLAGRLDLGLADAVRFAVPLSAGFITLRLVLNSETTLVFGIPFLAAGALGAGIETGFFFPLLLGGFVGAHLSRRACRRFDFLRIGVWTGAAQALATLLWQVHQGSSGEPGAWWAVGGALAGGMLAGITALGLVPLAEALFGYTTDMRLMELASMDHPLLHDLMLRAPGTYHHSIVTGTLVKAAAEAIGARAVLAMVAAYYHDIGKVGKSAYYIENQEGGKNPHDKLSPSMSTLVLVSHVKEGVELADRYGLGKDITDVIRQHHGTALMRYFHQKAVEGARPGVDEIHEEDFRYPGPKPQTREAALVLLADAVEAAARTLPDPRPARIQGMVQNLINRIFADGQLDECDLALKDLHNIARVFTRILSGIHHQRIDYPLAAYKEHKDKKDDGNLDSKRQPEGHARREEDRGPSPENLKRLGM